MPLAELWMVVKPSFLPEFGVILRRQRDFAESDDPFSDEVVAEKWLLELVEAKEQIWKWKRLDESTMALDIRVTNELNKKSLEVTKEFAVAVCAAWESVLRKTRYPERGYRGLDGTTYQFYRSPELHGEIWSPTEGLPSMLTDLGSKLVELARAEKANQEAFNGSLSQVGKRSE